MANRSMMSDMSSGEDQVRVLTLNKGEHLDSVLYRVKKGWQIEFRLGPSLFGRTVNIFTNHPQSSDKKFDRHTYYQLQWNNNQEYATLRVNVAGSFHYYITDPKEKNYTKGYGSGYGSDSTEKSYTKGYGQGHTSDQTEKGQVKSCATGYKQDYTDKSHEKSFGSGYRPDYTEKSHEKSYSPGYRPDYTDKSYEKSYSSGFRPEYTEKGYVKSIAAGYRQDYTDRGHEKSFESGYKPDYTERGHLKSYDSGSAYSDRGHVKSYDSGNRPDYTDKGYVKSYESGSGYRSDYTNRGHVKSYDSSYRPDYTERSQGKSFDSEYRQDYTDRGHIKSYDSGYKPNYTDKGHAQSFTSGYRPDATSRSHMKYYSSGQYMSDSTDKAYMQDYSPGYMSESREKTYGRALASGYILVEPELRMGTGSEVLTLDCIQCQTVLSKCLGPFSTWEEKLMVTRNTGYNMIHFTPIQELGGSESAYSLSDQLKLNSSFYDNKQQPITFNDVGRFAEKLRNNWNMLSICDIVLNHTANESAFLMSHPECTYNCFNSPHLRPAYLLDAVLFELTLQVAAGDWEMKGIPRVVETEDHLNAIRHALHSYFLPLVKIHELYTLDVNEIVAEFLNLARTQVPKDNIISSAYEKSLMILQDPQYRRLKSTVDMQLALRIFNTYRPDCFDEETRLKRCGEEFRRSVQEVNESVINTIKSHLNSAIENTISSIRYFRVQSDGPKLKEISARNPLVPRYFTDYGRPQSLHERESIMYSESGSYLMAHNGWVMNGDPLKNFADADSNIYIRRELIAWGDSVKLRYGNKPEDNPFLWQHMTEYVEQTARIFDGIRLDNCHSTPIPVAEYFLDVARRVRPDLYVVAELFTNSDQKDNIFVNRLGITSLIREAMSAWDSHEQGRLIYRFGGEPVGAFFQSRKRPMTPCIAHALFMDQTHDNPCPIEKRSIFDMLPSSALVSMACCASGSSRGYDELVPHHIHVVDERRQYMAWSDHESMAHSNTKFVNRMSGMVSAKRALNELHYTLGRQRFNQVFVDQMDSDIVAVTRHSPDTHESVVLVAFTAFSHPDSNSRDLRRNIRPLRVEGIVEEIIFEGRLMYRDSDRNSMPFRYPDNHYRDETYINGIRNYGVDIKEHIQVSDSRILERGDSGDSKITQLNFHNFQPGSVVCLRVSLHNNIKPALHKLDETLHSITTSMHSSELQSIIARMTLSDLNKALYCCDQEERDETDQKFGVYDIPGYGPLVYAGFQGVVSLLADIRPQNDLGHPLCANLRDGNWLADYVWQRLRNYEGCTDLSRWFEHIAEPFNVIPRYLVPAYFDAIVVNVYMMLIDQCYNKMSRFVQEGSTFIKYLSLVSVQVTGIIRSAQLPDLSPNLLPPRPKIRVRDNVRDQSCTTISAGLPHFAIGYMRNWGRDTFIALRGILLLTGRYEEARFIILGFAATLRHALIPNLLDKGVNARFNCRDALWWWLYTIQCYIQQVPDGIKILNDKVSRLFPTDDSPPLPAGRVDQPLHDLIQEALSVHFQGLCFRERNAGRQIDEHMIDRGFNNQIGVNPETGFVFGGNDANCGTWMDKMGSSERAGTNGKPATPRDGSAIEIVGLSKAVLTFFSDLHKQNLYPHGSVQRRNRDSSTISWSYKQWADKIESNFEKLFYIKEMPTPGEMEPDLIHRRGIYKDCFGASQAWANYQLRPNFAIAMVVAPELFTPRQAWNALKKVEEILLGPLGMKTLDPADWNYNGYYDNSNDTNDPKVAQGYNYHQGPEWVWPIGYFLRARLHFAPLVGGQEELERTIRSTEAIISKHLMELSKSHWRGLPELTNKDGEYCRDSCRTQAWSASSILEVLHELQKLKSQMPSMRSSDFIN